MSHSRRSSQSSRSFSRATGDPFNDASVLESAYASSEDDATPVTQRTAQVLPSSQIAIPYPVALGSRSRRDVRERSESPTSEGSHIPNFGRRGSPARRRRSVSSHLPPPVSLQTRPRPQSIAAQRPSRSAERATSSHRTALSISDGVTSTRSGRETPSTEWASDASDTAKDPFATPRKGSQASDNQADTETGSNGESARVVYDRSSTQLNQLGLLAPERLGRQRRRESDQVDPSSLPNEKSPYYPTKYSPEKRDHKRNFSRPFNNSGSESGSIAEEPSDVIKATPHVRFDHMFDPGFSFRDGRKGSQSLHPQAQKDAQQSAQKERVGMNKEAFDRRKSSCVLVNRRKSHYTVEEEKVVRAEGKKRLKWTKWGFCLFFFCANALCITVSWKFEKYWYVFAPVILLGNVLNTLMVLNLVRYWLWRSFTRLLGFSKPPVQPSPTTIAMVLACYCENYDELMATLESLHAQENIEQHKKMFLIIVDGQVKGKGMSKTTDRILVEDIFKPDKEEWFPVGYESWDGAINGIYACAGIWRDVPYVCLVKKRNLGKRDGLILVRTLLYKYQFRYEHPETSMGDDFFRWFCEFTESLGIEKYEWLVGVDADTTFNTRCIYELHYKCIQDERLIGCSGLIQVGFRTGNWNPWNLYQNAEYIRAQCLRRMHQAKGTGKVSCLPGACQIIKICEETCSDKILIETFGHIPDPKDHMVHQVRALAGEDRNYICIIFKHYPKAITCMAMNAIAFTDPPNGFMVFLSQRKRWTLSTSANDMLIMSKNAMNWFERICSCADVIVWILPVFVAQTLILFIRACVHAETPVFILSFATVTLVPMLYGLVVTFWACKGWREKLQYLAGFAMVVMIGQMLTPVVIVYAIWHMDDFSWGKTREIEDDGTNKPAHSD